LKFTIVLLIRNCLLLLIIIVDKAGTNDDDTFIFDVLVPVLVPVSPVWGWQGIPVRNLNAALNTVERN